MTIKTKWELGEKVIIDGERKTVKAVHIYVSEQGIQTERYYFGKQEWYTIQTGGGEAMTNFERIKAMSVEEMAEFIRSIYDDDFDYNLLHIDGDLIFDSDVKEWLEREDADNGR